MSHEDDQVRIVDCDAVEPAELQDSRPEVVEANPVDARTALLTHLLKRVNVSSTSARLGCFAGASIDACKRWVRQDSMRRVAVTGIGVVSPLGNSPARAIENAFAGRSGIRTLDVAFAHRLRAPLGATVQFDGALHFDMPKLRMLDRFSLFALFAANQAMAEAGGVTHELDRSRAGVFIGNGIGGTHSMDDGYQTLYGEKSDRIKPFTILLGMTNAAAAWIGIEHEFRGPVPTYSTACSSSAVAQANDAVESAAIEVRPASPSHSDECDKGDARSFAGSCGRPGMRAFSACDEALCSSADHASARCLILNAILTTSRTSRATG